MDTKFIQHTRTSGLRHTYDIEYDSNKYRVFLRGKLLGQSGPMFTLGDVVDDEAMMFNAISAIENLTGMDEE